MIQILEEPGWKRNLFRLLIGFALLAALNGTAFGEEFVACPPQLMADRVRSEACWLRYRISPQVELCLDHALASEILESHVRPALCGKWHGKWSEYSPLSNSPHSNRAKLSGSGMSGSKLHYARFNAVSLVASTPASLLRRGSLLVEHVRENVSSLIGDDDPNGVLRSLLLGEKTPESPSTHSGLMVSLGLVHLLFAAGLHLYALAYLIDRFFGLLVTRSYLSVPLGLALSRLTVSGSWIFAWLLAGARPGMLRPLALVCLQRLAARQGIRWRKWTPLALALIFEFAVQQFRPLTSSAWEGRLVYALAVSGGMLAFSGEKGNHIRLAIGSWILVALMECWNQGLIAVGTPLLSLVTLPLMTTFVFPAGLFFAMASLFFPIGSARGLQGLNTAVGNVTAILERVAMATPDLWACSQPALICGAICGAILIVIPRFRGTALSILTFFCITLRLCIPTSEAQNSTAAPLALRVEQLDIGQGDAALIEDTRHHFGLIDSGSGHQVSELAWLRILAPRDILRLDYVALTHLDEDHSGGVKILSRLLPVGCVVTSKQELESERGQKYRRDIEERGIPVSDWDGGCFPFPFLPPDSHGPLHGRGKANGNMSAMLVPLAQGGYFLSAGDADAKDEPRIGRWAEGVATRFADGPHVLKISHHGSRTSSNPEFLREIRPTEAWISVGWGNHYGHPAHQTLERLAELHIPFARTDESGMLTTEEVFRRRR